MSIEGGNPSGVPNLTAAEERQIEERVERVRAEVQSGKSERSQVAPVDPKDRHEAEADMLKGARRRDDIWDQVMNYHGFHWFEASECDAIFGMENYVPTNISVGDMEVPNPGGIYLSRPRKEGQWRHVGNSVMRPMAFTMNDLWGQFQTPEAFDTWFQDWYAKQRMRAIGLVST